MLKKQANRRTHSTIDSVPADVLSAINLMITDGLWPDDEIGKRLNLTTDGKPTYDDITAYLKTIGYNISRSAVGRYSQRIAWMSKMRNSAELAKNVMAEVDETNVSKTQKAVAEMITARAIELLAEDESATANDLRRYSQAIKDCTAIAIKSDQYTRQRFEEKAKAAENNIDKLTTELSQETRQKINKEIRAIYGIYDTDKTVNSICA